MLFDTLFYKELYEGRLCDDGVVSQSVLCDPALHIRSVVVSGEGLVLREVVLDSLEQLLVRLRIEKNETLREDFLTDFIIVPRFFLTLLRGLLFFNNFFSSFFIEFLFLNQEYFSCLSICSWESIKYVTSISAIVLSESLPQVLEHEIVGEAYNKFVSVDLLGLCDIAPGRLDGLDHLLLNLVDLSLDALALLGALPLLELR
jgi:hypothetical protein